MTAIAKSKKTTGEPRVRETPELRRKLLIQATMRAIAKYGYPGCTIEKICNEAQVSRGLINHHFDSKDELIRQSYKELCDEWNYQTQSVLAEQSIDAEERLKTMIRITFGPNMIKQEYLGVWIGFWGAIGKSPALRKVHREQFNQDHELYRGVFDSIARQRGLQLDTRQAALALIALINGFWLEWCLNPQAFERVEAERACLDFVASLLR